ncbi:MAG: glycosyltransferase, partial [Lachnospiraceae bacterium]|nr:glycosyltransferase [Lachnospiraceae bacterium]
MSEENKDLDSVEMAAYFRKKYEKEKKKNEKLLEDLEEVETDYRNLKARWESLKQNFLYQSVLKLRIGVQHCRNFWGRVKRYGSVKELIRKIESKRIERSAYKYHGTESFLTGEALQKAKARKFSRNHVFSILIPLYNTPEKYLRELLDSVEAQIYGGWELCFADGSDEEHGYVADIVSEYASHEGGSRIKYRKLDHNGGISENTNACFDLATGDYYALMDHDDLLHPSALYEYMKVLEDKDAWFIYSDEATFKGESINNMVTLHFKPDFAIDNLRANNYICHFSAFKRELIEKAGKFRSEYDGSQDHDLILRLTHEAMKYPDGIVHVPHILYYWRSHEGSTAADINAKTYAIDAAKRAVASALERDGMEGFEIHSSQAFATIFRLRYKLLATPLVSIIIPNKDHEEDLRRCVDSVLVRTAYDNYEIIIVENGSTTREIKEYYEELAEVPVVKIIEVKQDRFNYSELINKGVEASSGEYILMLNNDTEVLTRTWIEELMMYGQRDDVGAVGCTLYYPNLTIQHAGII